MTHRVLLWGSLRPHTGGAGEVTLSARTIRALLAALERDYPGTRPFIEEGIAVSVNGTVYQNSPGLELPEGAEIVLLPRLKGG